jgi:hypothetical protein
MANLLSFLILMIFLWGRTLYRKNLRLHVFIMLTVIAADLLLVLGLVERRDALGKIGAGMPWTLQIHVPIAIFTLVFYFVTAWTGWQLYGGRPVRHRLRRFDRILVVARVLTLVTSLMVQFIKV